MVCSDWEKLLGTTSRKSPAGETVFKRNAAVCPACEFSIGDSVVVKSGGWEDTTGIVRQINHKDRMVTINIDMFGRETPVEISFNDVEKV